MKRMRNKSMAEMESSIQAARKELSSPKVIKKLGKNIGDLYKNNINKLMDKKITIEIVNNVVEILINIGERK